ncbi:MATE family efflux transporter [Clostridium grantii]|uniref:Probable multidrug resistance protein NorM n=1 Tax=Clostridium grantii DSM 8605 TaxID=1121316 RepID=A0A1M5RT75_9CLOT|nr:MATE family efflux transporter [Clostridium grantii]SHH29454.1 putative efflux protein, MATE family [Clostridium grantii DSM 8605]
MKFKGEKHENFYGKLLLIAVPIVIQNFISSSLNMVDTVMIGKLGDESIAAVGLGNKIFFLFIVILFGVYSGASIFTAQYWGKNDIKNVRRVLGVSLVSGILIAFVFTLAIIIFPKGILKIFSKDVKVIELGAQYISIVGISYVFTAVSFAYGFSARTIGQGKIPMAVSAISLGINTLFNYMLIFGKFGAMPLGVKGAAYATLIARIIEFILILFIVYNSNIAIAAKLSELMDFSRNFVVKIFKTALPVILNEFFWSLGMTTYAVFYARMSTEAIASIQIGDTIVGLFFILSIGLGNSCAVMLGNEIGANNYEKAIKYSKKFFQVGIVFSVILTFVLFVSAPVIVSFFNVSDGVANNTILILKIISLFLIVKTCNMIIIVGILRSGGDTKYAMVIEMGSVWLIGVPLVWLGTTYWHLPIYIIVFLANIEEVIKLAVGIPRVLSKKWVKNLVNHS